MNPTYNIYRHLEGNAVSWVGRVTGLQQTKERAVLFKEALPADYIIFDVRERTVVEVVNGSSI